MEEKSLESLLKDASYFYNVCTKVFIQHAPRKKRHICGNNKQFMNNILFNVIVLRKKFRYKLLKSLTEPNKYSHKKQRNWCVYQEIYIYIYIYILYILSILARKILQTTMKIGNLLSLSFQRKQNLEEKLL